MTKAPSPDDLMGEFAASGAKVTFRMLDGKTALIEGSAEALSFLGRLLLAQAQFAQDSGFQIAPNGAGSAVFTAQSTLGLYIHRQPNEIDGEHD